MRISKPVQVKMSDAMRDVKIQVVVKPEPVFWVRLKLGLIALRLVRLVLPIDLEVITE